ncbi:chemotaxis response regulator protein-glutamate methylesterase [Cohnella suwonensis]|uniref:Protein-glutamate methylesterase/protein-glutamine glutaminase n=1 Tax=Cohnella suwonensis TaxID=696072 RepID=A0ABW0M444_9BACL
MAAAKKIRVLIVDDSLVFREVLRKGLSSDPAIEVVAVAVDPFDARDKILRYQPDVMTSDVEMPKMNGIEFIRRLLPQYALPVVVVSSVNAAVFDAMKVGAVDFVAKPDLSSVGNVETFLRELIRAVKIAAQAKVMTAEAVRVDRTVALKAAGAKITSRIVAIGASTGGTEAIYRVLRDLPSDMPGIVIVQHIPPVFSRMFADRLDKAVPLEVKEAEDGDRLEPGRVLIAPGDRHVRVRKIGDSYKVECFQGDKVNGHCPSVDVLFDSIAKEAGNRAVGVILTGMGYDGAKGLLAMRRKGARTIGQDEGSSVVYGMPKAAYEIGAVEKQARLSDIAQALLSTLD